VLIRVPFFYRDANQRSTFVVGDCSHHIILIAAAIILLLLFREE
jgi:hypothetical protein